MLSPLQANSATPFSGRPVIHRLQRLALLAFIGCLVGTPHIAINTAWGQPPMPPEEESPPAITQFDALPYPGQDNWLISGTLEGCEDPEGMEVIIGGAVSTTAFVEFNGYFEVLVNYGGNENQVTANATYNSVPLPEETAFIGY